MAQIKYFSNFFLFILFLLIFASPGNSQIPNPQLIQLRQQLALNYMKPAPHLALAKYYWSKGDRLQAFHISEYARRARFPQPVFDQAFNVVFGKALGLPVDTRAELDFNKAAALQNAGKIMEAEELFVKAAELSPGSVYVQTWVGRFFLKVKTDNQKALQYYLNAYFLDPHAYESEYVESRIRKINWEEAQARFNQLIKMGYPPVKLLGDFNPTIVVMALENMAAQWNPAFVAPLLELMSHDDETVRWQATEAIMKNVDRTFDPKLQALLKDEDLRKRGLAAYIAIHLWKQESFDVLRKMLREEAQLLRFDAVSALILQGGKEGLQIVREYRLKETEPALKKMIDNSLARP